MAVVAMLAVAGVAIAQKPILLGDIRVIDNETMESIRRVVDSELVRRLLAQLEEDPLQGTGAGQLDHLQRRLADGRVPATLGFTWLVLQEGLRDGYLGLWREGHGMPTEVKALLLLNCLPVPSGGQLRRMTSKGLVLGERDYDRLADELLSVPDDLDGLLLGLLYKLHDGDNEARVRAALFLGQLQEIPGIVVPHLLAELPAGHPRVVQEIITALGMIGPSAKDAIPTLEKLTEHADPQITERAKAALRQVRG